MAELTGSLGTEAAFEGVDRTLERLREGDHVAFAEVFQLYRDMVYTLALKLLTDRSESLDVTQEVFLTLFRKARSFRGECSLKTWLYRVTINAVAGRNRWWRRRRREALVPLEIRDPDRHPVEPAGCTPSPARACLSAELRAALDAGLRKLPFEQRVALVLREVEGLSYEDIAAVTGAGLGTVKSRIARAREQLRNLLADYQGGERL
ncbi:MAG: sigma-70 family RNA polymerase sigma factor [Acidobacteriota bacterium]